MVLFYLKNIIYKKKKKNQNQKILIGKIFVEK